MAELAGLIVGGVALASTFSTCVDCFEYIQVGRSFGSNYGKHMLKLDLVKLRHTRWGESTHIVLGPDDMQNQIVRVARNDADKVNELLGEILAAFQDAERVSKRFKVIPATVSNDSNESPTEGTIVVLRQKIQDLAHRRQKHASLKQKAAWALYERKHLDRLIEDVSGFVNDLIELFPGKLQEQQQLCIREVTELAESTQGGGLEVLQDAADGVDVTMEETVKRTIEAVRTGHAVFRTTVSGNSKLRFGDEVINGAEAAGGKRLYAEDTTASDFAKVHIGTYYGDKSFLD